MLQLYARVKERDRHAAKHGHAAHTYPQVALQANDPVALECIRPGRLRTKEVAWIAVELDVANF